MSPADSELTALLWLLALPRIEKFPPAAHPAKIRELVNRQVKIFLCPGDLHANQGAPLVHLHVYLPGHIPAVKGSGNNLYVACERVHAAAWKIGIKLPFLSIFHTERQRDPQILKPQTTVT